MIRIGVLRGGTNNRYDDSLGSGAYVLRNLPRDKYEALDIFVDTDGVWHLGGLPVSLDRLRHRVDVIWNALHGFYGEDGKLAQSLEALGIPYTGPGPLSSAITMNKKLAKDALAAAGIRTPRGIYVEEWGSAAREETVMNVTRTVSAKLSPPWIVEAISRGNGNGPMRAATRDELSAILFQMFDAGIPTLVEEAVLGTPASIIASSGFRGQDTYAFLPMHAEDRRLRLHPEHSGLLQKIAREVHERLGLGAYSRIGTVIDRRGNVSVTSVETGLVTHADAELHDALLSVGSSFSEFAEHMIRGAMERK